MLTTFARLDYNKSKILKKNWLCPSNNGHFTPLEVAGCLSLLKIEDMKDFIAGTYISQGSYKSFQPTLINRQWNLDNMEVIQLLSKADRDLGRLDMYSNYIPNIDLFISMHVLKEATQSSKIEGTHTNIEEALREKEDVPLDKRDDWEEVQKQLDSQIQTLGTRAINARKIVNYLYHKPLINAEKVCEVADISFPSAYKLIGELEKLGILKEITGGLRSREYIFDKYINLFQR